MKHISCVAVVLASFGVLACRGAQSSSSDEDLPDATSSDIDGGGIDSMSAELSPSDTRVVRDAAHAILLRQDSDGAIFNGPTFLTDNKLVPYFGNLAARSLCMAAVTLGDASYSQAARRWLDWYAAHMNTNGTVYDYSSSSGVLTTMGDFDSTDSYGATFVDAVYHCNLAMPGLAAELAGPVASALAAVDLTYQSDGLTFAKPSYLIKYAMDNVEVRRGLASGSLVAPTATEADIRSAKASRTLTAIDGLLWVAASGRYSSGMDDVGGLTPVANAWYPDDMAQLMAIAWLPRSPRRDGLYASVNASSFNVPSSITDAQGAEYAEWWGVAAKTMGDTTTIETVKSRFTQMNFENVLLNSAADYGHVISIFVE